MKHNQKTYASTSKNAVEKKKGKQTKRKAFAKLFTLHATAKNEITIIKRKMLSFGETSIKYA